MTMTLISLQNLSVLLDRHPLPYDAQYDDELYQALAEGTRLLREPDLPIVVANITGGVLQGASANCPMDVYALDFETDSCDDNLVLIGGSDAYCYEVGALVDTQFVADVIKAKEEAPVDAD